MNFKKFLSTMCLQGNRSPADKPVKVQPSQADKFYEILFAPDDRGVVYTNIALADNPKTPSHVRQFIQDNVKRVTPLPLPPVGLDDDSLFDTMPRVFESFEDYAGRIDSLRNTQND